MFWFGFGLVVCLVIPLFWSQHNPSLVVAAETREKQKSNEALGVGDERCLIA